MKADGSISFKMAVDATDAQKELKKVERKIEKLKNDISAEKQQKSELQQQLAEAGAQADETKRKIDELKAAYAGKRISPDDKAKLAELTEEYRLQNAEVTRLNNQYDRVKNSIASSEQALAESETRAGGLAAQIAQANSPLGQAANLARRVDANIAKLGKRIMGLAKRVFVFTLITQALRAVKNGIMEAVKSNEQAAAAMQTLKNATSGLYAAIANAITPALSKFCLWLSYVINLISTLIAKIFKVSNQAKKATGGSGGAKAAEKQLMGFDEINKLNDSDSGGSGSGAAQMAEITSEMERTFAKITAIVGAALIAVGFILLFFGKIGLGLALIIAGFSMMYAVAAVGKTTLGEDMQKWLMQLMLYAGAALLAIGLIVTFAVPGATAIGIGMIIVGAASMAAAVGINWDYIPKSVQQVIAVLLGVVGLAMLAISFVLLCSGANIPLGIGLMLAGGLSLYAAAKTIDWDYLKNKIQPTLESLTEKIEDFRDRWNGAWQAVKDFMAPIVQTISGWLSSIIEWVQTAISWLRGLSIFGGSSVSISASGSTQSSYSAAPSAFSAVRYEVPALARGAVIPPNREFMAVLGDQSSGRNLEAPEELIRQIVREETGNDRLISLLVQMLEAVKDGKRIYLDAKEVSSTVTKYQRQAERAGGWA